MIWQILVKHKFSRFGKKQQLLQETADPTADVKALIASLNEHIITSLSMVKASDTCAENAKKKEKEEKKIE